MKNIKFDTLAGGVLKLEAIGVISNFLANALEDYPQFIIVS